MNKKNRVSWCLLLGSAMAACSSSPVETKVPATAVAAPGTFFERDFPFACSPLEEVGCTGVFAPRVPTTAETRASGPPLEAALVSGEEAFAVRVASLRAATRSIRIEALIFKADEVGLFIAELLKKKKAEGVDVKLIVDASSNLDWRTQWMYFDLKKHGIEVEGYEVLYLEWLVGEHFLVPWRANKRYHDKMWIIDAEDDAKRVAIVGGMNIANEYFRAETEPLHRWLDQDVVLHGPIIDDVVVAFERNWEHFRWLRERLPRVLNPDNLWRLSKKTHTKIEETKDPHWLREEVRARVESMAALEVTLAFAPITARFVQSRPRLKEALILQAYLNLIDGAKKSILIANAYFIPSRPIVDALKRALARGVKVTVLTNSAESNDIASVALVSRYTYKEILSPDETGIRIYEWIGPDVGEGTLHAKFAVFDDRDAIIGSYNLDPRSERLNSETAVALRSPTLAASLAERYRSELLPKSRPVTWADALAYREAEGAPKKFKLMYSVAMKDWL